MYVMAGDIKCGKVQVPHARSDKVQTFFLIFFKTKIQKFCKKMTEIRI